MDDFSAAIVRTNTKGRTIFWSGIIAVSVTVIVLMILGLIPVLGQLVWIGIFVFSVARYYLQTRKKILKKPMGQLSINQDSISIMGVQYNIDDLAPITLSVFGWKSYNRSAERSMPVSEMHAGDKNFISFGGKDAPGKIEFLLESVSHWEQLRSLVIGWYQRGIKVNETVQGMRSHGLEVLNYAQIQAFKKMITSSKNAEA